MTPLGILLSDIWHRDATFHIEQGCFSTSVKIINRPIDGSEPICIETDNIGRSIEQLWLLLYGKDMIFDRYEV